MRLKILDPGTADVYAGIPSRKARQLLPVELHEKAAWLTDRIAAATDFRDLASSPALRLEKLKGTRHGQYSLRINDQYRIIFEWEHAEAINVEIVDYH